MKGERKWLKLAKENSLLKVEKKKKRKKSSSSNSELLHDFESVCSLLVGNRRYEWDKRPTSCGPGDAAGAGARWLAQVSTSRH